LRPPVTLLGLVAGQIVPLPHTPPYYTVAPRAAAPHRLRATPCSAWFASGTNACVLPATGRLHCLSRTWTFYRRVSTIMHIHPGICTHPPTRYMPPSISLPFCHHLCGFCTVLACFCGHCLCSLCSTTLCCRLTTLCNLPYFSRSFSCRGSGPLCLHSVRHSVLLSLTYFRQAVGFQYTTLPHLQQHSFPFLSQTPSSAPASTRTLAACPLWTLHLLHPTLCCPDGSTHTRL